MVNGKKLTVSASPHLRSSKTTRGIMLDVIIALIPALIAATVIFGPRVLAVTATTVITCVLSEFAARKIMKRSVTIGDLSAVVTGIILAFNLPVSIPLWMAAVGSIFAIVVVKQFFGGIGQNFANPAITARIVLLLSFGKAMGTWTAPLSWRTDAVTTATPLAMLKAGADTLPSKLDMLLGLRGGCLGETCAIALIIGFIYLLARRVISATIPVVYVATIAVMSLILGYDPVTMILTGGELLGGIFMLTDYATSPSTEWGKVVFALGAGVITMLIRNSSGGYPEGVSFAILLMNILCPHIDKLGHKKPFGVGGAEK